MNCTVKTTEKQWLFIRNVWIFYIILFKLFIRRLFFFRQWYPANIKIYVARVDYATKMHGLCTVICTVYAIQEVM
jgi:hypothetical protein